MTWKNRGLTTIAAATVSLLALAGCSPTSSEPQPDGDAKLTVVSGIAPWGDLATQIGGDAVEVTSIIDRPEKDPHEYEATSRDQLALSRADVVIENGGGFDEFINRMLQASDSEDVVRLTVEDITDAGQDEAERNEHFWYDYESAKTVAAEIAQTFSELDPDNAQLFTDNLATLDQQLDALIERRDSLKATYAGTPIGITEPLADYLLDAIGLENQTSEDVSEALEEGGDVPPALMRDTLELYRSGAVDVLVYKEQRVGPQNEQILAAAEDNGIPVAMVQETFEPGTTYVEWMNATLDALQSALEQ